MPVTWLHISDFHLRTGDSYDRNVVLRALVKSVADYRKQGRVPDLIFATGDIAHSGKSAEYEIATQFFSELLAAAELDKHRLFVIPGNHDVDRDLGIDLIRTLDSRERADNYFQPGRNKLHLTQKLGAYLAWHNKFFEGIRQAPYDSTCGPAELLPINGCKLGILPINSALFCQGDDDHDKLWIGRRRLDDALAEMRKLDAEMLIILVHHPLDWLCATEAANIQSTLEANAHILLRGHLHETRVETVASPEGELFRCAAGAAYQTRKWPNRALYTTLEGSRLTIYPIRYEDAPTEIWTTDPSVFPREPNHEKTFQIPRLRPVNAKETRVRTDSPRTAPLPRFRSNITSRGNRPFVGREDLLAQITAIFAHTFQENVVVVHGQPGVGKSELAREFARLNLDRYSGGTFWIDASKDAITINLAAIGKNILDLVFPADLPIPDQAQQTFNTLSSVPVLLIYDNVESFERIAPWLPLAGSPCHVLITTLLDQPSPTWPCIEVRPLSRPQSFDLVEKLTGGALPKALSEEIVNHADGLPVEIVPDATTLAFQQRRGRLKAGQLGLARQSGDSFRAAYDRLEQPTRLLLNAAAFMNPQRIAVEELSQHLREGLGWSEANFDSALETCLDLHLLQGSPNPTMHQLFAKFLGSISLSADDTAAIAKVIPVRVKRFVELAKELSDSPANAGTAAALISYPLGAELWDDTVHLLSVEQGMTVGRALYEIGRFDEARQWFERAVAKYEKGNVNGRVDHKNLGLSLHQVGYCLVNTGRYDEARSWSERAVSEQEQGDMLGRVDHEDLGRSLHQVGASLSRIGRYDEARGWFERAVVEKKQGDVYGRVDHENLGRTLHELGYCLWNMGRDEEALSCYEGAVAKKEQGDVLGRVDHESLGCSLHRVGLWLWSAGRYEEAQPWYVRAVAEKEQGDVHGRINRESLGGSLHFVGFCLMSQGRYYEARSWFERAIKEKEEGDVHGRVDHGSLAVTLRAGANCLRKLGENHQAEQWERRAAEIDPQPASASAGS